MDTYQMTLDYLLRQTIVQDWPALQDVLNKASSKRPRDWQLPVLACRTAGGSSEQAIPACAAIACLQISIILIDDMLDADPRGEHHYIGAPAAANLAVVFYAIGLDAIFQSGVNQGLRLAALNKLSQMMLTTAYGQHLDVQGPKDEDEYWHIVRAKSSPYFGSALYVGALMGGASTDNALQIERFGHLYGELIQIHDDLNDTMAVPANPDWTPGHTSLPILFAQGIEHAERARFFELREAISDPAALEEAQNILIRCGAVSYCIDQILRRYQAAKKMLDNLSFPQKEGLDILLEDIIEPVEKLFEAVGVQAPDDLL